MKRLNPARASRGFTLIEVLAALAVLAVAMSALIAGAASYANNAAYLRDKTLATWVARNVLIEYQLAASWPDPGRSDGDAEMAGQTWDWDVLTSKTEDPLIRRIDVTVNPPGGDEPVASLTGFVAP